MSTLRSGRVLPSTTVCALDHVLLVCLATVFTFVGAGNKCPLGENCIMNHYCPKGPKCVFRKQGKCKFVGSMYLNCLVHHSMADALRCRVHARTARREGQQGCIDHRESQLWAWQSAITGTVGAAVVSARESVRSASIPDPYLRRCRRQAILAAGSRPQLSRFPGVHAVWLVLSGGTPGNASCICSVRTHFIVLTLTSLRRRMLTGLCFRFGTRSWW